MGRKVDSMQALATNLTAQVEILVGLARKGEKFTDKRQRRKPGNHFCAEFNNEFKIS